MFSIFTTFKGFFRSLRSINNAQVEVRSTTAVLKDVFQRVKDLAISWGTSIIIKGVKAVYQTIVHIGSEIGKHRYSILRSIYGRLLRFISFLEEVAIWALYSDFKYVLISISYIMIATL